MSMAHKRKKKNGSFFTKRCFVLIVGDDGAVLLYMEKNRVLRRLYSPGLDPQDTQVFKELIATDTKAPMYVIADIMDQSYIPQSLPPVSALSVTQLINKRLERDFAPTDIRGAILLGRSDEGRRDWNYLFVSTPNIPPLSHWIDLVAELPNRMEGIYLLPVEAVNIIKRLWEIFSKEKSESADGKQKKKSKSLSFTPDKKNASESPPRAEWRLLVSHNKVGGFRQVVTCNNQLVFTRLTQPVGEVMPEVIAGNIEQEIANTIEYLRRLSFRNDDGIEAAIIVSQDISRYLKTNALNAMHKSYIMSPHEAAEKLGLMHATLEADHFGDVVLAAEFGQTRKKKLALHTQYTRSLNKLYRICDFANIAAAIIIPVILLFYVLSGINIIETADDTDFSEKKRAQAQSLLSDKQSEIAAFPIDVERIADVVSLYEAIGENNQYPLPLISRFATLLSDKILVQSIAWDTANFLSEKIPEKPVKMVFKVEFLEQEQGNEEFIEDANIFIRKVKTTFPEYDVQHSRLPGIIQEDEDLEISFDDDKPNKASVANGKIIVDFTLTGPIAVEKNSEEKKDKVSLLNNREHKPMTSPASSTGKEVTQS